MPEFAQRQSRIQNSHLVSPAKPDRSVTQSAHAEHPLWAHQLTLSNQEMQRRLRRRPDIADRTKQELEGERADEAARLEAARNGLAGSAAPLAHYPRAFLESRFRTDFSRVRIHTDDRAARENARLGAAAYNLGEHIAFGRGNFAPRTEGGLRLLAHELAHVVQQRQARSPDVRSSRSISNTRLEVDADRAVTAVARGERPTIWHSLSTAVPLLHPVYISRHGDPGFLANAFDFYRAWGYSPITRNVDSVEQIVGNLATQSAIGRVTIVSHAHPEQLFVAFLSGGPSGVRKEDWRIDTLEELPKLETHVLKEDSLNMLIDALRGEPEHRRRLERIRIGAHTDPIVRQYLWWALEFEYVSRAGFQRARQRRLRLLTELNVNRYRDTILLAYAAVAGFGGGAPGVAPSERDFVRLRESIRAVAATLLFPRPPRREQPSIERGLTRSPTGAINRVLRNPEAFLDNLEAMRNRISGDSWIEVQGCRAGQDRGYLVAMREFFSGPRSAPKVSAPDWFQFFGNYGHATVTDSPHALRSQWRRRRVREALDYWSPIITGRDVALGADWEALRDYLAGPNVLPLAYPGRPGILDLLVPAAMPREAFLAWLSRHSYRLTRVEDIRAQFIRRRRFSQLVTGAMIDWLQEHSDREGVPTAMAFRPDPEYDRHIIKVP